MSTQDGTAIAEARICNGWSQQKLAQAAGLSLGTVANAERHGRVTAATMRKVATALGLSVDALKGRSLRNSPALTLAEKVNDLEARIAKLETLVLK